MTNRLITLIVDEDEYTMTSDCLNSFPNSLLTKMINNPNLTHKHIINDDPVFYINRDPKVIAYIVDLYRGYNFDLDDFEDLNFKHRVTHDLKLFNLFQEIPDLDILPDTEVDELIKSDQEAVDIMLDPTIPSFFNQQNGCCKPGTCEQICGNRIPNSNKQNCCPSKSNVQNCCPSKSNVQNCCPSKSNVQNCCPSKSNVQNDFSGFLNNLQKMDPGFNKDNLGNGLNNILKDVDVNKINDGQVEENKIKSKLENSMKNININALNLDNLEKITQNMNNVPTNNMFEFMNVLSSDPVFQQIIKQAINTQNQQSESDPEDGDLESDNELPTNELPD
ncbi:hypothetical protein Klosneuvirus_1_236 [Klosneuvirus KNV1]|uniref:Uncharacterized protein n=1 Tax=Klosneuvirus KNV1 TaxID=1977640 RepID=A0A1V0SI36_9VIRU|nr:hypothetical protein Klosneuvirus_1_236 [Klosneuvirus KNV1]